MAAARPSCSISNCGRPVSARGWCGAHYYRWQAHGDPLAGKARIGEPMRFLREVAMACEGDECVIWPYAKARGYGTLTFNGKMVGASRWVCQETHGAPPTPAHEAAHSCGNGDLGCVSKNHLSWKTHAENESDKLIHGTHNRGERHSMAKLSEKDVIAIRSLGASVREMCSQFGVSRQTIVGIRSGERWGWLNG